MKFVICRETQYFTVPHRFRSEPVGFRSEPVGFRSVPSWSLISDWFRLVSDWFPTGLVSDWFRSDSDSKWNQLVLKQILIRTAWNDRNPQEWAGIHRNEQYVLFLGIFLVFFLIFSQYFTLLYILHRSTQNSITIYDLI